MKHVEKLRYHNKDFIRFVRACAMKTSFKTQLQQAEGMNATGIRVPVEAIAEMDAGKKPKVKVRVNGYEYRSTVAAYAGDVYMLPFASEHRQASGIKAGDEIDVTLEVDTEPRLVEVPEDLAAALAEAGLREAFEKLSPSARKEHVRQVESAKAAETRMKRIVGIVSKLSEKG
jgi:hypothetical protein